MIPFAVEEVLAEGIAALRWAAAGTHARIGEVREAGPLWLTFRDLDGLADRLEIHDAASWRRGEAWFFVTGQDVGVLDNWLDSSVAHSPYRGEAEPVAAGEPTKALASLRAFLEWYLEHHMELLADAGSRDRRV